MGRSHQTVLPSVLSVVNSGYPRERWRIDLGNSRAEGLFAAFPEGCDGPARHHVISTVKPGIAAAGVIGGASQAPEHNASVGLLLNIQIIVGDVDASDEFALRRWLIGVRRGRKECAC